MLLREGLTHIQSQIKPRLLFGESFDLRLFNIAENNLCDEHKFMILTGFIHIKIISTDEHLLCDLEVLITYII